MDCPAGERPSAGKWGVFGPPLGRYRNLDSSLLPLITTLSLMSHFNPPVALNLIANTLPPTERQSFREKWNREVGPPPVDSLFKTLTLTFLGR